MKKLYTSIILAILFCISTLSSAQKSGLTGFLADTKGVPVSFANVALLKATDSSFIAGVLTDSTGHFTMAAPASGMYFLRFTAIGFAGNRTALFEATGPDFAKDFGTITLKVDTKTLQGVSVESLRPTLTQLPDKLVVSVEGTAMAAGNTAYAVLAKSPGVFIDPEGNIQLNGKSGIMVMIDGRQTFLSARDLRTMLESMPAENLKNIEIITNPSSKY
ncbi:MAG TPA: TonB-dependent receptor, partial [Flavisolibacter sp.]|nr:TonB-dependent receptor [Flavisolibacter sp.]